MRCPQNRQTGFTYIGVLIAIALIGLALSLAGESWRVSAKREKEKELLFIGHQFRKAIELYYLSSLGVVKQYPASLEDLLKDPRYPTTRRYLRRIYPDPFSGKPEWGLIRGANNGIVGVYSLSEDEPVKQGNFSADDAEFEGKTSYKDWKFAPVQKPGVTSASGSLSENTTAQQTSNTAKPCTAAGGHSAVCAGSQ